MNRSSFLVTGVALASLRLLPLGRTPPRAPCNITRKTSCRFTPSSNTRR
jgi:hypothetical protein